MVVNCNSWKDVRIIVSFYGYSICIILHSITELRYFYIKSITMFKFLVAKLGYQVKIPGSPSTFQVAFGYRATTKSYTVETPQNDCLVCCSDKTKIESIGIVIIVC